MYNATGIVEGPDITKESPLFVDIGGANGPDAVGLLSKHPSLASDAGLAVQDLNQATNTHGARSFLSAGSYFGRQDATRPTTTVKLQLNGLQKAEGHLKRLLKGCGLSIVGITLRHRRAVESVTEAEPP